MYRMIPYRGFEIHVELTSSAEDLYNVSFQIKGGQNLTLIGERGGRIRLRNGPFTRRWAYLIAEVAGQAAIDVLLGPPNDDGSAA
ncbi:MULTISPECIES: hypothetical protein [Burkholderia cepacia complex]|jgi:hypothetical protein|uniref:Uncharacterized protein n=2 Tax=Burkholderia cepacia complex TaxID=87882 RepID=A0AAD0NCN0_9BURK|nr:MULTISPECIES: hypothetical protein [Burkholderia cepacia complex]ACA90293.1 conserved hypothetical protein [Burkholderia orbicola MC0-3]AWG30833.1 hypothetical protein B9Z07_18275 [Burkholderia cenocepacia]MBR8158045.1 hypothetical protein [Burkholderia cenocepacia]MCA8083842.1 hypothetical protein [Burkholderia cenocepacia]PRE32001.1 hypothetical protein C6P63_32695 [Burkholderia cenocepacia]